MDLGELSNFRTESGRRSVTVGDWFQEPPHTNIPRCSSPLYKTAEYNEYSWDMHIPYLPTDMECWLYTY